MWLTPSKALLTRSLSLGSWRGNALCLGLALSLFLPVALHSEGADPAAARVSTLYDALLQTMKEAKQLGLKGRYDKLAPVLAKTYDLPLMTRIAVGQSWDTLSAPQRQSIVNAFTRMTTATYANRFDGFSGESLEVVADCRPAQGRQASQDSHRAVRRKGVRAKLPGAQHGQRLEKSSTSISMALLANWPAGEPNSGQY